MNFFERLSPTYAPPSIVKQGRFSVFREQLLHSILLAASLLGLLSFLYASRVASLESQPIFILYYGLAFVLLLVITTVRALPYSVRSYALLVFVFTLALYLLIKNGNLSEARFFLIGFIFLSALLFDLRHLLAALLLSLLVIIVTSLSAALGSGLNFLPRNMQPGGDPILISLGFFALSTAIAGPAVVLMTWLKENLLKQDELAQTMESQLKMLDEHIAERTRHITDRLAQFEDVLHVIHSFSPLANPEDVMREAVETILVKFDLYYAGVFLVDPSGQNAVLRAGTGEAGRKMLADGHSLAIGGNSMIGWAMANRILRIALDVGLDAVRFSNPNLPLTRSELALPLLVNNPDGKDKAIGAITVQSTQPDAFSDEIVALLSELAHHLAVILQNDLVYQETHQNLEDIRVLNRDYMQRSWAESIESYGDLAYTFDNPSLTDAAPLSSDRMLEIPLLLRDEVIGQIVLETDRTSLSQDEAAFIESITNQTALALESARLLLDTERRAIQEQKLSELTARFSRAQSIDEILQAAAQELGQLPSVTEVSVWLSPASTRQENPKPGSAYHGNGNGKEPSA